MKVDDKMEVIPTLLAILATTALPTCVSLRVGDDGVCTKQQTVMRSEIITYQTSYAQRYETCTLVVFCSTKYRTAYRSSTRTRYRAVSVDVLICCQNYYQDGDGCKPKAVSTLPMTPSSSSTSQSTSPPSDQQSAGYNYSDYSYSSSSNYTSTPSIEITITSTLPNVVVGVLPLETKMMISGGVLIPVILLVIVIFILITVSRKRRKHPPESPRHSQEAVDGNQGDNHQVGYYTVVPNVEEDQPEGEASIQITNGPTEEFSARSADKKSKRFNPLQSVFYTKVKKKGKNKKLNGGQSENKEESHYYANMDESPSNVAMGYMDMRGSTSKSDVATPLSYTDMNNGQGYSEMENSEVGKAEANAEPEFEPYDKVVPNNKVHTSEAGAYDKLERTDSVLASVPVMVNQNPYDCLDVEDEPCKDDGIYVIGGMVEEEEEESPSNQELSEYSSPRSTRIERDEQDVGNERLAGNQNESVYYNTPEETARNRRESDQENIYTNVSY